MKRYKIASTVFLGARLFEEVILISAFRSSPETLINFAFFKENEMDFFS